MKEFRAALNLDRESKRHGQTSDESESCRKLNSLGTLDTNLGWYLKGLYTLYTNKYCF